MNRFNTLIKPKTTLKSVVSLFTTDISTPSRVKQCSGPIAELGQPTYWTHPHLFRSFNNVELNQQVTPGLTRQEFQQRRYNYATCLENFQRVYFSPQTTAQDRAKIAESPFNLLKHPSSQSGLDLNFIAVIPSAMVTHSSPDVPNKFKQNSDFLYLTGFKEPSSVLVVSKTDASDKFKSALFVRDKNPRVEVWEGPCTGPRNINKLCGDDLEAYPIGDFKPYLNSLIRECSGQKKVTLWRYPSEHVFKQESGPYCHIESVETALDEFINEQKSTSNKLIDMSECEPLNDSSAASYFNSSRYFVQLLRSRKSRAEVDLMRRAGEIASESFIELMKVSHPFINEHLMEAKFDYDCRIRGADGLAYIPVIAGGSRATSLHYIRNNQLVRPESMVLVDAGCQYNDYVSDITRTWPVGGRFRGPQKDLYEMCLRIQKHCIGECRPGVSIQELYFAMMRKMGDELSSHGILDRAEFETVTRPNESRPTDSIPSFYLRKLTNFCPHDVGHYLGLDVHDSPEVSKSLKFEPNTVITIEPGIYIQSNDESVPGQFRGIGIRIEDDVVVTETGCSVLTEKCPKQVVDIEKFKN